MHLSISFRRLKMKIIAILGALAVIVNTKIRIDLNKKGKLVSHPFARVHMIVQSLLYKIYA